MFRWRSHVQQTSFCQGLRLRAGILMKYCCTKVFTYTATKLSLAVAVASRNINPMYSYESVHVYRSKAVAGSCVLRAGILIRCIPTREFTYNVAYFINWFHSNELDNYSCPLQQLNKYYCPLQFHCGIFNAVILQLQSWYRLIVCRKYSYGYELKVFSVNCEIV